MATPVLALVDDEEASLQALTRELESRYGAHYRIVASASAEEALARLEALRAEGAAVALILADQWMPGTTGSSSWRVCDWEVDDPSGRDLKEVRRIRDEIADRVRSLTAELACQEPYSPWPRRRRLASRSLADSASCSC